MFIPLACVSRLSFSLFLRFSYCFCLYTTLYIYSLLVFFKALYISSTLSILVQPVIDSVTLPIMFASVWSYLAYLTRLSALSNPLYSVFNRLSIVFLSSFHSVALSFFSSVATFLPVYLRICFCHLRLDGCRLLFAWKTNFDEVRWSSFVNITFVRHREFQYLIIEQNLRWFV